MIFLTGIITGVLFLLLQIFPPLGVLLPIYKIKKLSTLGIKDHLIVNVVALILVTFVDFNFSMVYLAFLLPELGYYFIVSRAQKLAVFDRIILVVFLTSTVFFAIYYLIFTNSAISFETLRELYKANSQISGQDMEAAFTFIKDYSFYLAFLYSFFMVFFVCFFFKRESFIYWEISYLWITPYILLFFLKYFGILEGLIVENALKILQVIFIPYGLKSLYMTLLSFSKSSFLSRIAIILIFIYNPQILFIYGVIFSGGNKKFLN
ncbi:MAG: hypothetical protein ACRCTS_01390 [Fusobacteriaceae bacterium]